MDINTFLTILIPAVFASQGFWALILYKVQNNQKEKESNKMVDQALLVILRDLIFRHSKRAILRGYTDFEEFENITDMYEVYEQMGGNGTGRKLYDEYCRMPKDGREIGREEDL